MMARTPAQNKKRAEDCRLYRSSVGDKCELSKWLKGEKGWPDSNFSAWVATDKTRGFQTHHICDRGKSGVREWATNLIVLSSPIHAWVEREAPARGMLACLFVKFKKHFALALLRKNNEDALLPWEEDWNPEALDPLVSPCVSIGGKIVKLMGKMPVTSVFFRFGEEMLTTIENDDLEI